MNEAVPFPWQRPFVVFSPSYEAITTFRAQIQGRWRIGSWRAQQNSGFWNLTERADASSTGFGPALARWSQGYVDTGLLGCETILNLYFQKARNESAVGGARGMEVCASIYIYIYIYIYIFIFIYIYYTVYMYREYIWWWMTLILILKNNTAYTV